MNVVSAAERGLRSYVAVDACAALDEFELRTTADAGVIVANYTALVWEVLADNADPKAMEVYQNIRTQYSFSTLAALSRPAW